jgi:hypothetical protein
MYKEVILASSITLLFLIAGIICLESELFGYGSTFFALIPFTIGYILGGKTIKRISVVSVAITLLLFAFLLVVGELEGMICVLMATPFVVGAVALGFFIKWLVLKIRKSKDDSNKLKASLIPLALILVVGTVEHQVTKDKYNEMTISTSIDLPHSCMDVYDAIKSVDTLDTTKPFLMKLDLPVPQKCILEAEEVGAMRTCYFEGGVVTQQITALEPGKLIDMEVIDYQLTGRKWMGFTTASYTFEELPNDGCRITRNTAYTSQLYPRFYWEPLEKLGLEQEHEYVMRDLAERLNN